MVRYFLPFVLLIFIVGCHKDSVNNADRYYSAEIVDFDLNCSNCILKFAQDNATIKDLIGESNNNYYHAINLDKDTFKIGQKLNVKLRKANEDELTACINLYPSFDYLNVYILNYQAGN